MNTIAQLKLGNEATVKDVYNCNKQGFISFAGKYDVSEYEATDIYQDAVIALIENARKGKLDNLKSSLTTYLFAIGKFMLFAYLKKQNKQVMMSIDEAVEWNSYETEQQEEQTALLQKHFEQLGEQCRKMLTLFYYEEKKLEEIMHLMNYDNKDVVKSQKYRCLKQLKNLMEKNG